MKFRHSIFFCALSGALFSGAVSAQTLSEAVDRAIKSNPEVLMDASRRLASDEQINQARGGYRPRVDLSAGLGSEWSDNTATQPGSDTLFRRESALTLSQMLYDGAATKSQVERGEAMVRSAAYRVAGTSEDVALRVVAAYLEVARRQEQRDLTRANLAAHERVFEQIKLRTDSGIGRRADLDQTQARLALAQANLVAADAALRDATIQFRRIVGEMPNAVARPENPQGVPASEDEAVSIALGNHPLFNSAEADIDAAKAQTRATESLLRPRVDLQLGTDWNNNLDGVHYRNNDAYAMVRFKYNLYNGGTDQARVAESRIQEMQAAEALNNTLRLIEESTRLSWSSLLAAGDSLPKMKERVAASEKTREAYANQFIIGQRTLLDLLDSENELYTARQSYLDGQYVELLARYRLLANMGKLLATLGVAPREEARVGSSSGS
ncbi:MAG: TolC family outer membrane protein [Methylobacillus sp.]|jgi:adhesin transport system outer membrane protein|nr:TolC family outer membrane protein [Methylobacillus sp.]